MDNRSLFFKGNKKKIEDKINKINENEYKNEHKIQNLNKEILSSKYKLAFEDMAQINQDDEEDSDRKSKFSVFSYNSKDNYSEIEGRILKKLIHSKLFY